jgi:hypothetical protein
MENYSGIISNFITPFKTSFIEIIGAYSAGA